VNYLNSQTYREVGTENHGSLKEKAAGLHCLIIKEIFMKKAMLFLGAFLFASSASAAIKSLVDDFEGEGVSGTQLDYNSFTNWDVTDGTVDLKQTGTYGITCNSGSYCVDLDGSTRDAGVFTSKEEFQARAYEVSFAYSGNQRGSFINGSSNQSDTFLVEFSNAQGVVLSQEVAYTEGWSVFSAMIILDDVAKLSFSVTGGDNQGVVLDDISVVSAVPVPAAAFLFAPALIGFMGLRRKAKKA
jgi:hypothetical protein